MTISNAQWVLIQERLKLGFESVNFTLHGHDIKISRSRISERSTVLIVFINGTVHGKWMQCISDIDPKDEFMNKVVKLVWRQKHKAIYSKKQLETIAKNRLRIGAKRAKELWGEAPEKARWTYLTFEFCSSAALVRQYKKIDGLKLISELNEVNHAG